MSELGRARVAEIEELLALAEETAERISRLRAALLRSRIEIILTALITYGVIGASLLAAMTSERLFYNPVLQMAGGALAVLLAFGAVAFLYMRWRVTSHLRQELAAEARISSDLLTMIAGLMKDPDFEPPPVKAAVLQMRLRRLEHSPTRPS